jgi:hypothetical protein
MFLSSCRLENIFQRQLQFAVVTVGRGDHAKGSGALDRSGRAELRVIERVVPHLEEVRCQFFVSERKKVSGMILHAFEMLSIRREVGFARQTTDTEEVSIQIEVQQARFSDFQSGLQGAQ